jgi:hypothetical protein
MTTLDLDAEVARIRFTFETTRNDGREWCPFAVLARGRERIPCLLDVGNDMTVLGDAASQFGAHVALVARDAWFNQAPADASRYLQPVDDPFAHEGFVIVAVTKREHQVVMLPYHMEGGRVVWDTDQRWDDISDVWVRGVKDIQKGLHRGGQLSQERR